MKLKQVGKALLFPHVAILIVLLPVATVFLTYSLLLLGTSSPGAILSYVLAFYTLVVWSARIPGFIRSFRSFKRENKFALRWQNDPKLRVNASLYGTLIWNTAYALLQLGMGFWHRSFWFYSLAGYYLSLAVMRFFLVQYASGHRPGEKMREELVLFRRCGRIFLVMNLALSLMIFFMVYWGRTFRHHEITTIALAAYTFTAFTVAIVNLVKYRKYKSPVISASKAISLAAACVSMLTLESTMLTTFGDGSMSQGARKLMLSCTGGVISLWIVVMAIYMIRRSNEALKSMK